LQAIIAFIVGLAFGSAVMYEPGVTDSANDNPPSMEQR